MAEDNVFESAFSTDQESESPIFSGRSPKSPGSPKGLQKLDAKGFRKRLLLAFIEVVIITVLIALVALIATHL